MTFCGNIVCLRPRSVICGPSAARDANDTTRTQINNIPEKSHFIIIIINIQGHIISRYLTSFVQFLMITSRSQYIELKIQNWTSVVFASTKSVVLPISTEQKTEKKIINHNTRLYLSSAALEDLRFMSLVYGLCMLRFKHFVRGKKFDDFRNDYIPADNIISNLFVSSGVSYR